MANRAKTKTKAKTTVTQAGSKVSANAVAKKVAAAAKVATTAPPTGKGKTNTAMGSEKTATAIPSTTGIVNSGGDKRSARLSTKATKKAASAIEKAVTGVQASDPATFQVFPTGQATQLIGTLLSTSKETPRDSAENPIPGGTAAVSKPPSEDSSVLSEHEIQFLSGLTTPSGRPPMTQILRGYPITTGGWDVPPRDVPIDTLLAASPAQKRSVSLTAKFLEFMDETRSKCKAKLGTVPVTWEVTRDYLRKAGQTGGRITPNVQCKRLWNECNVQKCRPQKYAHGTMGTHYATLHPLTTP